ncbi:hypothetical protein DFH06DRAFT_1300249 [Mycena polygramma]|nr:hypothetical protein DFH06DRAFT_1300249 [Mycena polygramma]
MASLAVSSVLGPVVVGVVLNSVFYGVCALQFYEYATRANRDSLATKCLVVWIAMVDTFSVSNSTSLLWHYAVDNFGNDAVLLAAPWQYSLLPLLNSLASVPIQLFLGHRVKSLSNSWALYGLISCLALAEGAMSLTITIQSFTNLSTLSDHPLLLSLVVAYTSLTAACDILITGSLIYLLQIQRTGFKRTDFTISRLVRTTVETAIPVTICCVLLLATVTGVSTTTSNISLLFGLLLGRLYTNTLMTTLNARAAIRKAQEDLPTGTFGMEVVFATRPGTHPTYAEEGPKVDGNDSQSGSHRKSKPIS